MTQFPHLLEARIQDAKRKGTYKPESDDSEGPTALPMEVVLMQEIQRLKAKLDETEDPDRRAEIAETLVTRRQELSMHHERAGRHITASMV